MPRWQVGAGIVQVFRQMRGGAFNERQLEAQLQARGLMYRFFGRFMRSINHTWQLYFVGLIFGIGFDTATEVVLLAATAYAAIQAASAISGSFARARSPRDVTGATSASSGARPADNAPCNEQRPQAWRYAVGGGRICR